MPAKFLLITDLDNTLVGNDRATIALNEKLQSIRDRLYLIYATGRSHALFSQLTKDFQATTGTQLLEPDYLIAGVGTEIYRQGTLDWLWAERISQDWNRETIAATAQSYVDLIPQPESEQNPWKISFYLNETAKPSVLGDLQQQIAMKELSARIIFSSGRDVDILPSHADKGIAAEYLREHLGVSPQATLVCGDSGNDISLFHNATCGVIVSNAQSELLEWHKRYKKPDVYLARSPYAWGILEALSHFKLLA